MCCCTTKKASLQARSLLHFCLHWFFLMNCSASPTAFLAASSWQFLLPTTHVQSGTFSSLRAERCNEQQDTANRILSKDMPERPLATTDVRTSVDTVALPSPTPGPPLVSSPGGSFPRRTTAKKESDLVRRHPHYRLPIHVDSDGS